MPDVNVVVVGAGFTTCDKFEDVELAHFDVWLDVYAAVIVCVPSASVDTEQVAFPDDIDTVTQPVMLVPLSWNVTVPEGVPTLHDDEHATVAVNVTDAPAVLGFRFELNVVFVAQLELHVASRTAWWTPVSSH